MSKHPKITENDLIKCEPPFSVKEMIGKIYGRLTIKDFAGKRVINKSQSFYVNCKCICGKNTIVSCNHLKKGKLSSCGCLKKDFPNRLIHGEATTSGKNRSKIYNTWKSIRNRCNNPNEKGYERYGGNGIKVCNGWSGKNGFINFKKDMSPITNKSIDRIDNNLHYSCGHCEECIKNGWVLNCRWADDLTQSNNRGDFNRLIEIDGQKMTYTQASRYLGFPHKTLQSRICHLGWDEEKAITTPLNKIIPKKVIYTQHE